MASSKWSGTDYSSLTPTAKTESADDFGRTRYLRSRRTLAPNQWFSNHLSESQRIMGATYLALRVLGDAASQAEVSVWQRHEDATADTEESDSHKPLPWDHPLASLIRHPNNKESFGMVLRRNVQQLMSTGSFLTWQVVNGFGTPAELWTIPTACQQPAGYSGTYPEGAYRIQNYWPSPFAYLPSNYAAGGVILDAREVVAGRLPHPLVENEGFAPMSAAGLQLDTMESIDRSREARVRKGVRVAATVELAPEVTSPSGPEADRALQEIESAISGVDKDGDVCLLPPGAKLTLHDFSSVEMGWLESWNQLLGFNLAIFGVGKSIANLAEDVSFAQLYAALRQFSLLTMGPLLQLIADAYNLMLIHPHWGPDHGISLKPQKISNDEEDDRRFKRRSSVGLWSVNEARVFEGMEPTEEKWGEERAFVGKTSMKEDETSRNDGKPAEGDEDIERSRPRNPEGRGSAGPREILAGLMRGNGNGNGRDQ